MKDESRGKLIVGKMMGEDLNRVLNHFAHNHFA